MNFLKSLSSARIAVALVAGVAFGVAGAGPWLTVYKHDEAGNLIRVSSTAIDPDNCGNPGTVCSRYHVAARTCSSGSCDAGSCEAGWADCDHDKTSNGCETNAAIFQSSVSNCGGCGIICSRLNMSSSFCSNGKCHGACSGGYMDCNGDIQKDGCETWGNAMACPPLSLVATAKGSTSIQLGWRDMSYNELAFLVERKLGPPGSTNSYVSVVRVGANVTNFLDSGLLPNSTYTYRVLASTSYYKHLGYSNEATTLTWPAGASGPAGPPWLPAILDLLLE